MKDNLLGPFQQELRKSFPHALLSDNITYSPDGNVQEAKITGISVDHISELLEKRTQHIDFRIEDGNLVARYSKQGILYSNQNVKILMLIWFVTMILTVMYMYIMTDEYRAFLSRSNADQPGDESDYLSVFNRLVGGA